jgi:hypothetical protein
MMPICRNRIGQQSCFDGVGHRSNYLPNIKKVTHAVAGAAVQVAAAREEKMRKVLSALAVLASSSGVSSERETFLQLVPPLSSHQHAML